MDPAGCNHLSLPWFLLQAHQSSYNISRTPGEKFDNTDTEVGDSILQLSPKRRNLKHPGLICIWLDYSSTIWNTCNIILWLESAGFEILAHVPFIDLNDCCWVCEDPLVLSTRVMPLPSEVYLVIHIIATRLDLLYNDIHQSVLSLIWCEIGSTVQKLSPIRIKWQSDLHLMGWPPNRMMSNFIPQWIMDVITYSGWD